MGLFKNIFKRKPGGTFFGNLIRGAVKSIPIIGGALGNGGMMISQEDADRRDLSDEQFLAKYGVTKSGAPAPKPVFGQTIEMVGAAAQGAAAGLSNYTQAAGGSTNTLSDGSVTGGAVAARINQIAKWVGFGLGTVALILGIIKLVKRK